MMIDHVTFSSNIAKDEYGNFKSDLDIIEI